MNSLLRNTLLMIAVTAFVLSGCGRKEAPRPVADTPPPAIAAISHEVIGKTLKIELQLSGGSQGIGYQIDRAEIDPYCKCPGFWRRFDEEAPREANLDKGSFSKLIVLKTPNTEYAFRVRAIDAIGRFSEWSRIFRVKADPSAFQ